MLLFYMFIKEIEVAYQKQKHLLYQNFNMSFKFTVLFIAQLSVYRKYISTRSLKTVKMFRKSIENSLRTLILLLGLSSQSSCA